VVTCVVVRFGRGLYWDLGLHVWFVFSPNAVVGGEHQLAHAVVPLGGLNLDNVHARRWIEPSRAASDDTPKQDAKNPSLRPAPLILGAVCTPTGQFGRYHRVTCRTVFALACLMSLHPSAHFRE